MTNSSVRKSRTRRFSSFMLAFRALFVHPLFHLHRALYVFHVDVRLPLVVESLGFIGELYEVRKMPRKLVAQALDWEVCHPPSRNDLLDESEEPSRLVDNLEILVVRF